MSFVLSLFQLHLSPFVLTIYQFFVASPETLSVVPLSLHIPVSLYLPTFIAGYGYEAEKYAARLGILFDIFAEEELPPKAAKRFFIMGGESNYLLRSVCLSL